MPDGDEIIGLIDGDCDHVGTGGIYGRGPMSQSLDKLWWVKGKERVVEGEKRVVEQK